MKAHLYGGLFCCLLASFSTAGKAQDIVKIAPEHNRILLENEHVRVIENTLAPGEKDAMHTHPAGWYYVKQPGTMKIVHADGRVDTWHAKAGEGGWLQTRDPHTAENTGKTTLVYVLVEVKSAATRLGKIKAAGSPRQVKKAKI